MIKEYIKGVVKFLIYTLPLPFLFLVFWSFDPISDALFSIILYLIY